MNKGTNKDELFSELVTISINKSLESQKRSEYTMVKVKDSQSQTLILINYIPLRRLFAYALSKM